MVKYKIETVLTCMQRTAYNHIEVEIESNLASILLAHLVHEIGGAKESQFLRPPECKEHSVEWLQCVLDHLNGHLKVSHGATPVGKGGDV